MFMLQDYNKSSINGDLWGFSKQAFRVELFFFYTISVIISIFNSQLLLFEALLAIIYCY